MELYTICTHTLLLSLSLSTNSTVGFRITSINVGMWHHICRNATSHVQSLNFQKRKKTMIWNQDVKLFFFLFLSLNFHKDTIISSVDFWEHIYTINDHYTYYTIQFSKVVNTPIRAILKTVDKYVACEISSTQLSFHIIIIIKIIVKLNMLWLNTHINSFLYIRCIEWLTA